MLVAELLCSDEHCAVTLELIVDSLDDLEALVCEECECSLQALAICEVELVELPAPVELRRAA